MAHFTIHKFICIVIFIALMIFFFLWMTNQVSELGLVFGFRTSHVIANDIASLITSVGGVPGDTSVVYSIFPGDSSSGEAFEYKLRISDKLVCATSFLFSEDKSTTDCATHSYSFDRDYSCETQDGRLTIIIDKKIDDSGATKVEVLGC